MRRRAMAVNTVANTSRTACGSGCTCCLTQVLSNSHTLISEHSELINPLDTVVQLFKCTCSCYDPPLHPSPCRLVLLRILGSCFLFHA